MRYYHEQMKQELPQSMQDTLQKNFPTNDYGVAIVLSDNDGEIDLVSIDRCEGSITGATKWTHYANLQKKSNGNWELNEQFKGVNEDEMWIYGYFNTFSEAVRELATKGTENRKPIKIN